MRRKKIVFFLLLTIAVPLFFSSFHTVYLPVESIQIRLFAHLKVSSLQLIVNRGEYRALADGNIVDKPKLNDVFQFSQHGDSLEIKKNNQPFGVFKYIKFVSESESEMKIKLLEPDRRIRIYEDNFSLNISESYIRVINEVGLDNYISGVTEAESGSHAGIEFYKVQSILARTFALAHINKHIT